jgi:UDP-glucose 4-epimerase
MKLKGTRVLVTGGAGFIGSAIVDQLLQKNCEKIVAVDNFVRGRRDNLQKSLRHNHVSLIEGDIRDSALMDRLIEDSNVVFHMAALRITQCAAEPRLAKEVMVDATFDVIEKCVKHKIAKVVAASSASVYGMADQFPTPETQNPYDNRTLYGAAKAFNEGLLRSFNEMYGLPYVAMRYFNAYGPRMDIHGRYTEVLIRWMERIHNGEPPVIFGDGKQTMDFVYVNDIARANIRGAECDVDDVVFNIGSQSETSLEQLAVLLARVMGRDDLQPIYQGERKVNPVPRRLADITAARELLGWEPQISLEQGLSDLFNWWVRERSQFVGAA